MKPLTDRRDAERFDIVGALWGQLELGETADVVNVSTTGVLVESCVTCALGSAQPLGLVVEDHHVTVDTVVRRIDVLHHDHGPKYAMALEFVAPPLSVVQSVEQLGA